MKLLVILILACLTFQGYASPKNTSRPLVYLGVEDYPPYLFKKGDAYQGVTIDVLKAVLTPLGYSYRIEVMPFERLYTEAGLGYGDLVAIHTYQGLTIDHYPEFLLVCPTPIIRIPLRFYTYQIGLKKASHDALGKLRIGVLRYARFQRELVQNKNLDDNVSRFNDIRYLFRALLADRIDVIISSPHTIRLMAQQHGSYYPYALSFDLGYLETFVAIPKKTEDELGIFNPICKQLSTWDVESDFQASLSKQMRANLKPPHKRHKANNP